MCQDKKRVSLCFIEKGPLPLESLQVHHWILFSFVQKFSQFPHWRRHSCAKSEICDLISQPAFTVFTLNQIIQHIRMFKVFSKSLTAILETLFKIYGAIISIWKWYGFSFSDVWENGGHRRVESIPIWPFHSLEDSIEKGGWKYYSLVLKLYIVYHKSKYCSIIVVRGPSLSPGVVILEL